MKLKNDYLLDFSVFFSVFVISMAPGMLILFLFTNVNVTLIDIIKGILVCILIIGGTFIINLILNFIINLFIKPKLILYNDNFIYKNKTYDYSDIVSIEYEIGTVSRVSSKPNVLVLYRKGTSGIVIKNPSIKMMREFKKRCPNKPFRIENYKQFFWFAAIAIIVVIIMLITSK